MKLKSEEAAERIARRYGEQAAREGRPYEDSPYKEKPALHLAWCEGHNAQRAAILHEQSS